MRKNWYGTMLLFIVIVLCTTVKAQQKAQVREYKKLFTTYPFSDPDPIPKMGRVYPYFRFDGYAEKPIQKEWKVVELENEYLRLMILPEIGGKVWATIEKSTGKSFVYYNHVIKFRDVAMRGPWTSGGVEANYGIVGHTPNCATPVDYVTINKKDGSVSCVIGVLDLLTRTSWRIDINLPKDKAYFTTTSFWYNPSGIEHPYYTWMNTGIKASGNLEFIYPGTKYLGHSGEYSDWPVNKQNGKNISFYNENDFGSYKSYHVFGKYTDFFGAYWHDDDFGMGRSSSYDDKPGKKIWIWGLSQQGMIWEKLLSDTDGQYVEVQSGRLFNQAAEQSSFSPFKNRGFAPHATDMWTEYWFPVMKTKGFVAANNYGALNLQQEGGWLKIYFSPLQKIQDVLKISVGGKLLYEKKLSLEPLHLFRDSVRIDAKKDKLVAVLGDNKLLYESDPAANVLSRPVEAPKDFDWNSAYGLYLQGKENLRMRNYVSAGEKLKAALLKEPYYVPALGDYAMLLYRNGNYTEALAASKKALSVDTYDPTANYYYGLINLALKNEPDAKDGFSIAAQSLEFRSAAYTELAKIFLRKQELDKAKEYATKAIDFNRFSVTAYEVLAVVYRLQKKTSEALRILDTLLAFDPLQHFARFEKYLLVPTPESKAKFTGLIRNELPHETFLELAIAYVNYGRKKEAKELLQLAPANAEINYWLSYLTNKPLTTANLNIDGVFPFRLETAEVLKALLEKNNYWVLNYHLALIEWHHDHLALAKELFSKCGEKPNNAPFYAARAELFFKEDADKALADLQKAARLDPRQWRYGQRLVQYYIEQEEHDEALSLAREYHGRFSDNYQLGMQYIKALLLTKRYAEANEMLRKINILPNEGATNGRVLYRETQLMLAIQALGAKNYQQALGYLTAARQWPENLGVGKPYQQFIDERLENWLAYQAYLKMGNQAMAQQMLSAIISFAPINEDGVVHNSINDLLTAWALQKTGKDQEGEKLLQQWLQKEPNNAVAKWAMQNYKHKEADSNVTATGDYQLLRAWMNTIDE